MPARSYWLPSQDERGRPRGRPSLRARLPSPRLPTIGGLRRGLLIIGIVAAAALLAAPSAPAARWVSYQTLLQQVRSGALIRAVINRERQDIEIKFRDRSEWEAYYPQGAQPQLQRILRERHIRVIFASHRRPKAKGPVHHHLRYIAAGALGALALIGAALLLYTRRQRRQAPLRGGDAPAA